MNISGTVPVPERVRDGQFAGCLRLLQLGLLALGGGCNHAPKVRPNLANMRRRAGAEFCVWGCFGFARSLPLNMSRGSRLSFEGSFVL